MFDRILIPLDGSRIAEAALAYAELLPSQRVRMLQVEPATGGPLADHEEAWEAWCASRKASGMAYLEQAGERLRQQGRIVEPVIAFGDPAACITATAADADLVIMTTHGQGAGERVLLGSVADKVARHGPCPTLLVRSTTPRTAPPCVARVLVPLDGSALATRALPMAAAVARLLGVPIHVVRVLDAAPLGVTLRADPAATRAYEQAMEVARHDAEAALDVHVHQLRDQDLPATGEVLVGSPAKALLDAIAATDIVVMTTHGYGGIRRLLLGSVAATLVREAAAPVLLIRAPDRGHERPPVSTGQETMMFDRILIPLDGSRLAEAALAYAEQLPSKHVELLQVEPATGGPGSEHEAAWKTWQAHRKAEGIAYLEQAGERFRRQGRAVESTVAFGDPARCILDAASDADLVVMTTHGRSGIRRWLLGSVADTLVRAAAVPVLLVRAASRAIRNAA
jgi:nucleotide-binding universal stress UspA family protein